MVKSTIEGGILKWLISLLKKDYNTSDISTDQQYNFDSKLLIKTILVKNKLHFLYLIFMFSSE